MDLFSKYYEWRDKPGKGVCSAPPDKGAKRLAFILSTHFLKLICLNMLFIVFCIPIITIPASLAGMTRVLMRLTRDGNCYLWADFWEEFKTYFVQRLLVWLALNIFPVIIAMILALLIPDLPIVWLWLPLYAVSLVIQGYLFPLVVILDVSLSANVKNAIALCTMEWKRSLLILATSISVYALCYLFFPISAAVVLLITFSLSQLILCVIVNEPIQKHLVEHS